MRSQIVMNAVTNALKYSLHDVGITARRAGECIVVEVTDSGPGLRGQTLAQLMTEFGGNGSVGARGGGGAIRSSGMCIGFRSA